jgi:hypothetical protein
VTEDGYIGFGYEQVIDQIEDAAINFCYDQSGGDTGCHLVDCTPTY